MRRYPNLNAHRAHDYTYLTERWRAVARRNGLVMRGFAAAGNYPLYTVRTPALPRTGGIYLSAGIHGDEAGSTEALIIWAEENEALLRRQPVFIVPCLNPWGLVNNTRTDAKGRDLNRSFRRSTAREIVALKRLLKPFRFAAALMLHEDYDGQGIYIYEFEGKQPYWGEALLRKASPYVPIEGRAMIEGREALKGMVRRKIDMAVFREIGLPEAVYFHLRHCDRVFTIETPSEFGLDRRVRAQVAVIDECVRRARLESA